MYKIFHCFINPEEIQMLEPDSTFRHGQYYPTVKVYLKGQGPIPVMGQRCYGNSSEALKAAIKECEKEDDC